MQQKPSIVRTAAATTTDRMPNTLRRAAPARLTASAASYGYDADVIAHELALHLSIQCHRRAPTSW